MRFSGEGTLCDLFLLVSLTLGIRLYSKNVRHPCAKKISIGHVTKASEMSYGSETSLGHMPRGSYSPKGILSTFRQPQRTPSENPFPFKPTRHLLRTLARAFCKALLKIENPFSETFLEVWVVVRPLRRGPGSIRECRLTLLNSVHCTRRGSEKSAFLAISGEFWISQVRLFSRNSSRKRFKLNKIADFKNAPCKSLVRGDHPNS